MNNDELRFSVGATWVLSMLMISLLGAMGTNSSLMSEVVYLAHQSFSFSDDNGETRDLPPCGNCSFDTRFQKDGAILHPDCAMSTPYKKERYECVRWNCENNTFKYTRNHISWGNCINEQLDPNCPAGTCQ